MLVRPDADQLRQISQLTEAGQLRPTVSEVLPLAEARRAHELLETGHTRGKIVLQVVA
jgi:NADPH:quinone reductase-like Zn-dependent oxidoreductase